MGERGHARSKIIAPGRSTRSVPGANRSGYRVLATTMILVAKVGRADSFVLSDLELNICGPYSVARWTAIFDVTIAQLFVGVLEVGDLRRR
jgi:hypothetical protein